MFIKFNFTEVEKHNKPPKCNEGEKKVAKSIDVVDGAVESETPKQNADEAESFTDFMKEYEREPGKVKIEIAGSSK